MVRTYPSTAFSSLSSQETQRNNVACPPSAYNIEFKKREESQQALGNLVQEFRVQQYHKTLSKWILILSVLSILLVVVEFETDRRHESKITSIIVSSSLSLVSMTQVLLLCIYYRFSYKISVTRDPLWKKFSFFSSPLFNPFVFESVLTLIHLPPGIGTLNLIPGVSPEIELRYINLLVFLRLYHIFRAMRDHSIVLSEGGKLISEMGKLNLDLRFISKSLLFTYPMWTVTISSIISFFLFAYTVMIIERPDNTEFSFKNSLWFLFATMSTVGYGDVIPRTWLARFIAALAGLIGILFSATLTALVHRSLQITKAQKQVVLFLDECQRAAEVRNCAAKIIQSTFRIYRHKSIIANAKDTNLYLPNRLSRKLRRKIRKQQLSLQSNMIVFRKKRRKRDRKDFDVTEMLWADPKDVVSHNTVLQQLCQPATYKYLNLSKPYPSFAVPSNQQMNTHSNSDSDASATQNQILSRMNKTEQKIDKLTSTVSELTNIVSDIQQKLNDKQNEKE
eukprot:gb/GECH01000470.1/.p1 GENE.gb/GECH01000470.1/~~gb/GECH01000470.1/.p1  ORF type:complete len:507 (+),score=68.43 gb/GECH01000470.1/:1-1521(+)